jgi:ABC-type multidrug transport system fused ATPase/permease subunit
VILKSVQHFKALDFLLPRRSKVKLLLLVGIQFFISILDLMGLLLVGWIASLSISRLQGASSSSYLDYFFGFLKINNSSFETQIIVLCTLALIFFTFKTVISLYLLRRVYNFLAFEVVRAGEKTLMNLFYSTNIEFRREKSQALLNSVTSGVIYLILGYLGSIVVILTDVFLLIMIGVATFIADPLVAIFAFTYFGIVVLIISRYLTRQSRKLGEQVLTSTVESNQQILDSFSVYRELYLMNDFNFAVEKYSKLRKKVSYNNSKLMFLPNVSKYFLELSLVLGTAMIAVVEFFTSSPLESIGGVAIFFVAATRAFPAILRSQAASITASQSLGHSQITVNYLYKIKLENLPLIRTHDDIKTNMNSSISFKKVSFSHGVESKFQLKDISFEVSRGSTLGITGPSGSGKSTLIDLLIGLVKPESGEVLISGHLPRETISNFPEKIAYVPQDIPLVSGTLSQNILLGRKCEKKEDLDWLEELIQIIGFSVDVELMKDGLNTKVGQQGISLSGGQKQRIGIARALYGKPELIIFDEATSALDAKSESDISRMIHSRFENVTLVFVAHRLSTLIDCDQIIYLSDGVIRGIGTFRGLYESSSEFREQVNLSGHNFGSAEDSS